MTTTAEIISIGDELLYGQTLDTNSHWISEELDKISVKIVQRTTIGDQRVQILKTLSEAEKRADIVLITGGLGPTKDDLTKPLLAEYFGVGMTRHQKVIDHIQQLFNKANREMTFLNQEQADLPSNCQAIHNPMGTAPGMWFDERNTVFISMPGVPYEMKRMMTESIIPKIQEKFIGGQLYHRIVKTIGISESKLAEIIESWEDALPAHIKLAYLPTMGQVKLRMTATGKNLETLKQDVALQEHALGGYISKYIYGYEDDQLESVVGKALLKNHHTISTAESCTGGYLAHLLTSVPGSSKYYKGTIVSYSNEIKETQLDVSHDLLESEGAVSEKAVIEMAIGIRKKMKTDVSVAISGVAGPGGGTEEKL